MRTAPPKRTLYNPHQLGDTDLERTFIAHQLTFREVLADITTEEANCPPPLQLLVGQRGGGKTTLLLRLALELRRPPYRDRFVPLTFPEEQYIEVDRLSKLWRNCLDALADTLEFEGGSDNTQEARRIDQEVKALERGQLTEPRLAEQSQRAFEQAAQRLGRRPVLLIDNFHLLLRRLKASEPVLRAFFTAPGAPLLVAAATVLPQHDQDATAFYAHFKLRVLNPLTLEELEEIIAVLAREADRPELLNRLAAERPRLAALRDMTGGNPRTAGLLFDLFSQQRTHNAYEDLEALTDVLTPLYQLRLDQLSDQGQVILGTLARHWEPITAGELGESARLVQGSIGPQLGRLEDLGLIEKTPIFPEKKTGYQLAERLFNLWYLVRFSSRRQRRDLACLAHFLEAFYNYTPTERLPSAEHSERRAQRDVIEQRDGLQEQIAHRYTEAEAAYRTAIELDANDPRPWHSLVFLYRDIWGRFEDARQLLIRIPNKKALKDSLVLQEALFAAYESQAEERTMALEKALTQINATLPPSTREDWFQAVAVLAHLGQAGSLVSVLEETGARETMRPFYGAVQAHTLGDRRHLYNLPAEVRPVAEKLYEEIQKRREILPEATRHAPVFLKAKKG